ncbi:MAG: hypothetical protein AAGG07_14795 [Planctomycetota bacterium]
MMLIACGRSGPNQNYGAAATPQTIWQIGVNEPHGIARPEYWNLYESFDKYPSYGIITYRINEPYSPSVDNRYFIESVRIARAEYGAAYASGSLRRWDSEAVEMVDFNPQFVALAIANLDEPQASHLSGLSVRAGWLIPASDLFDPGVSAATLLANAVRDSQPFEIDPPIRPNAGFSANNRYKWRIIERHQASSVTASSTP